MLFLKKENKLKKTKEEEAIAMEKHFEAVKESGTNQTIPIFCPKCGRPCCVISDMDLQRYRRAWSLAKIKPLPNELKREYIELCNTGFRYINICCPDEECGYDGAILDEAMWNEMKWQMGVF